MPDTIIDQRSQVTDHRSQVQNRGNIWYRIVPNTMLLYKQITGTHKGETVMKQMYLCYFTVDELMDYLRRGYSDSVDVLLTNGRGDEADELDNRFDLINSAYLDTDHEWNAYRTGEFHEWLCTEIEAFHELTADII